MKKNTAGAWRWRGVSVAVGLAALLMALPALAGSASTTLPNGADLSVSIDSPADGTEVLADGAPVAVPVSGTASIGLGDPQATIVYVFDASGSTGNSGGTCGSILACEKTFFTGLNTAAAGSGSVNQIGLAAFGADAVTADMTPPVSGDDPLGDPGDGNTVINSIVLTNGGFNYQVGQYTAKNGDADGTDYTAALQQALGILNASSDPKKFVVFASDGLSNEGGAGFAAAVTAVAGTGAVVNSIAIGASAACTGGTDGDLADLAVNGGTCVSVPDPNDLPDLIPNLIGSTLEKVELTVDAGVPSVLTTSPATPAAGPVMTTWSTSTPGLSPGSHDVCATAFGSDVTGGTANVQTCVNVDVYDLVLTPASAVNELGSDNSHTVTATLQGPAGEVGGYLVDFAVTGQNAGATGVCSPVACTTNASGVVTFTYSVPVALGSIGVDTITADVTLNSPNGETDTEQVTKEWRDTTPPAVACRPTNNPGGNNIPPAGDNPASGQNPDGFYVLLATDDVDPNPDITVSSTGSSFVAGPYASGTKIKLTQAPGATPNVKPGAGDIDWHITLKGDAVVTATDSSGNSASVTCHVPPPPK
jgi:hypothetical protein